MSENFLWIINLILMKEHAVEEIPTKHKNLRYF